MNAIFLDVDGILNDGTSSGKIDEKYVKKLKKVCDEFDSSVVLYSDFKYKYDKDLNPKNNEAKKLINVMKKYNIDLYKTPNMATNQIVREGKLNLVQPNEVLTFLVKNKVVKYLLLGSRKIRDKVLAQNQIVSTDGLDDTDIEEARTILQWGKLW